MFVRSENSLQHQNVFVIGFSVPVVSSITEQWPRARDLNIFCNNNCTEIGTLITRIVKYVYFSWVVSCCLSHVHNTCMYCCDFLKSKEIIFNSCLSLNLL